METIARSGSQSFWWKSYVLLDAIRFRGKRSFQSKLFLLEEAIIFFREPLTYSRNHSIWRKLFLLMEDISLFGSYFFYWKTFILVETIPFSGGYFRQWKPLLLGKAFFLGNHCPQMKPFRLVVAISFQRKLLLLIKTFPFGENHSFQSFNIFVCRSYLQLRELLNTQCQIVTVLDY